MTDLLLALADTLPVWKGPAVALLAAVAIGCLRLAAETLGE